MIHEPVDLFVCPDCGCVSGSMGLTIFLAFYASVLGKIQASRRIGPGFRPSPDPLLTELNLYSI
jgi:hypothetical protein